jgi:hypothetical protein
MPYGRATPETVLQLIQGSAACRAGNLRPFSTPSDIPRRTPMHTRFTDYTFLEMKKRTFTKNAQTLFHSRFKNKNFEVGNQFEKI